MKKQNIISRSISANVVIDGKKIEKIYFDLFHIEFGWDQDKHDYNTIPAKGHKKLSDMEVVYLFEQLSYLLISPIISPSKFSGEKRFEFVVYDDNEKYKMIVSVFEHFRDSAVVITIYRV